MKRQWIPLLLLALLVRAFAAFGREASANQMAIQVKEDLRLRLFNRLQELGPVRVAGERTGELTAVVVSGVDALIDAGNIPPCRTPRRPWASALQAVHLQ